LAREEKFMILYFSRNIYVEHISILFGLSALGVDIEAAGRRNKIFGNGQREAVGNEMEKPYNSLIRKDKIKVTISDMDRSI
jgi:hypothetical protein